MGQVDTCVKQKSVERVLVTAADKAIREIINKCEELMEGILINVLRALSSCQNEGMKYSAVLWGLHCSPCKVLA